MKNNTQNVAAKYKELKPYQKKILDNFFNDFIEINTVNIGSISSKGMLCRKCGSDKFVKNGKTNGVQRYQCKACKSTQFHDANTPLYNLKLKSKWPDFVYFMLNKENRPTCQNISDKLGINIKTAHFWRHKLLASFNKISTLEIDQEAELDEVYFRFNVVGVIGKEKFDEYIAPEHPDNKESQLRIDEIKMIEQKYQTIFMCIHNRMGDFDFIPIKNLKKGIVSEADLKRVLNAIDISGKTIITDQEPSLKAYLKSINVLNHLTFKSSDIKNGILKQESVHNNNINNTMRFLKEWMKNFHGVSTKYMWNYLKWFRFIKLFELSKITEKVKQSLSDKESYSRYKNIFKDYKALVYA